MTSLKFLRFLKDKLETPYVVSYFFNELLAYFPLRTSRLCDSAFKIRFARFVPSSILAAQNISAAQAFPCNFASCRVQFTHQIQHSVPNSF